MMPIEDEPADRRIGPVVELLGGGVDQALVGQADQQERDRDREDHPAEHVEVARSLSAS